MIEAITFKGSGLIKEIKEGMISSFLDNTK